MIFKDKRILLYIMLVKSASALSASDPNATCGGSTSLLSYIDRPSVAIAACSAPYHHLIIESGYDYNRLIGQGVQQFLPQTLMRFGLADRFEVNLSPPSYFTQTVQPKAGFNGTSFSAKREFISNDTWVVSLNGSVYFPSGSKTFGNEKTGGGIAGIASYSINTAWNFTAMLGYSDQSLPITSGGQSYSSVNPDFVLSWGSENISLYGEAYGQNKTSPTQPSGWSADVGLIILVKKNIAIDFEIGQRIYGQLNGVSRYYGTGISVDFNI